MKFYRYLYQINIKKLFFLSLAVSLIISFALGSITLLFQTNVDDSASILGFEIEKNDLIIFFISAVILAPIVETLLFQTIPIYLIKRIARKSRYKLYIAVAVSALLFGLLHLSIDIAQAIVSFFVGIIFAFVYYLLIKRKKRPFTFVMLLHAVNNLIAFGLAMIAILSSK